MDNIDDIYELSPMQQGMLFHTLYDPKSSVYFEQLSCTLRGDLNISAFKRAWQHVMERHPALRTSFYWEDLDKPLQVVHTQVELPYEQQDWRGLTPSKHHERFESFLQMDREQGFALDKAPLMRCALIQTAENTYHFVWSYHHLLVDGWCIPIILKEVFIFYTAFDQGQRVSLDSPRPYRDYILWLQQQDLSQAEAFWRQTLQGFTAPTALVVDRTMGDLSAQQEDYTEQRLQLSAATTTALQSLARQHHLTLNTLMQGAWALLLSRYSGDEDVVFGVTTSSRPTTLAGVESMVGLFINTLPARVHVSGEAPLLSWLQQLQAQQVEREQYAYSPLVEIQGWSDVPRGLPLFESIVVFENYPVDASLQALESSLEIDNVRAFERVNYPLTVIVAPGPELSLRLCYESRCFDAATIQRMAEHLQTLLEGMVAQPQQCLAALPLLTEAERYQVLVEWNDTQTTSDQTQSIQQWFEAQVAQTPEAVAVIGTEGQLTYQALNRRANRLAHHLRALGVAPEVRVGLCVERSVEMVVGLLGILKAGGVYVPLDPAYPQERLAFMVADAQVPVLVTQEKLVGRWVDLRATVVCLEVGKETIGQEDGANPHISTTPDSPAYAIYTSGSTGQPKGVLGLHRGAINRMQWMWETWPFEASETCCQKTSLSFVDSVWETFGPLLRGIPTVIIPDDVLKDPDQLVHTLERAHVTRLVLVPSLLRVLLTTYPDLQSRLPRLKYWISSGEALPVELARSFQQSLPASVLLNLYGSSEVSADATWYATQQDVASRCVPIGVPIANTQAYILDRHRQSVPVGVPGELYVGGAGLARGYLNRPALTAETFIPHAWGGVPGARLYKTGDVARYLPDGTLEFLGRVDYQVKLRGFRIELGEIEARLAQHPAVGGTIAVVREDTPGEGRLVAYVMPQAGQVPTERVLRAFLREKLPDYMVPAAFVILEAWPLLPNGKVDRRALPAPDTTRREGTGALVAPRTPPEELLAGLWADVLGREDVSIDDNFFDLGGHSLLAMQLVARIRAAFGVEVPVRQVFDTPTVAGLRAAIDAARQTETGLLAPPLVPVEREGGLPLSFAQKRLWFLDQLEGGSATYNLPVALRLSGPLHVAALAVSLTALVHRHEALRTTFVPVQGVPVQAMTPLQAVAVPLVDLQALSVPAQEAEVRRLATTEAQRPFALAQGPLLRGTLVRLGETEHVLLLTLHHIVADGWSMGILVREMATLYRASCRGEAAALPVLPIQYADFAQWQRTWLQGEVLETQLSYWRAQLAGTPAVLDLPTDYPRPPVQTFRGGIVSFHLTAEVTQRLQAVSRQADVTLFMTLLGAFATFLYRYSGQEDVVVGSPIANRNRQEIEGLIGFFVNTLPLRLDLAGNPPFNALLDQVREVTLTAYAHQDLPFEKLVEELQPERSLSHTPLFQAMLVLQNAPWRPLELPGLTLTPVVTESGTSKFDLTLRMIETDQGLQGEWEYSSDLFDVVTIHRMHRQFETLLQGVVAHPEARVGALPLLSAADRHQLLVAWNATQAAYPQAQGVHEEIAAQAARTPEAVAVVYEAQQLTYRALEARANQLAHHLRALGVGPEGRVGVCLERSVELVIALLGVLKAGGAYVPLDPTYPVERLAFMLHDAQVQVLLTHPPCAAGVPAAQAVPVLDIERDWAAVAQQPSGPCASGVGPGNLMYVIYTSGSTGQPKGVMNTHAGLHNRLWWMQQTYPLTAADRVLQKTPYSFDVSVWEFFWPLLTGACLVLAQPGGHQDSAYLRQVIATEQITTLHFVPSMLQLFVAEAGVERCTSLRQVFCSGEALPVDLQERVLGRLGGALHNLYGPTEAAIDVTSWRCERARGRGTVPIGRPIANTDLYVLDRQGEPVPIGVAGELHIGGVGVARGYLGRAGLTAERFVPHPWSGQPGGRLYKTGDLARYASDGLLEFVGRLDYQVKVRGFRIELGEIETILGQHPAVAATVVVAREVAPGDPRLVAYVMPQAGQVPTESALRAFLREKLPDYMVPAAFVILEAWPLLPNGKVDRHALPPPALAGRVTDTSFMPPRTPPEELLAGLWADVLGREDVSIDDNFFDLGGHSLLAMQLVARIRAAFGVEVPVRQVFDTPTVAGLRTAIEARRQAAVEPLAPALVSVGREGVLPLSFAQQRLWFLDQLEGGSATYNLPAALRLNGSLHLAALAASLTALVRRHEALRTTFPTVEGAPIQVIAAPQTVPLQMVDVQGLPAAAQSAEVRRLVQTAAQRPFALAQGPLLRSTVVCLGETEHVLLLTLHHIVADGWSMGLLVREVATLYAAGCHGAAAVLPALPIQYADFAHWQRAWLQGEVLERQVAYWRQQLAGAPALLELPTDYPRPPVQSFRGATAAWHLSAALTQQLQEVSRRTGVTLYMTLLGAFATLLARYSGQEDIIVGSPIANRTQQETEGLIGFFVNTVVLRLDCTGNPSFAELLARVRQVTLEAYAHQEVPFEKLVEELQPERHLSYTPLFQVMLALQNVPRAALELQGLTLTPLAGASVVAKFDLTVSLEETAAGLVGVWEYNRDLFAAATIERMAGHFATLLAGLVAEPRQGVATVPLLSEVERQQLLVAWNATQRPYPAVGLAALFEAQVGQRPAAVAVEWGAEQVTYGGLNRRANQLAHQLRRLGVGPEVRVGLCVERSLEMVVGLVGILKAGGAYVPLDPSHPAARLAFMVADAQVAVLLTQSSLMAKLPQGHAQVLCLDTAWDRLGHESAANPRPSEVPAPASYVIYTSGSTGAPKGVLIAQDGLLNLVYWHHQAFAVSAADRATQVASVAFDASVWEVWPYLACGARVVLAEAEVLQSPEQLRDWLVAQAITISFLPTPLAEGVLALEWRERPALRRLLTGGDRLHDYPPTALPFAVVNNYGPTENTVVTTSGLVVATEHSTLAPPIGRPIANTAVYLLDRQGEPVPIGVPGEIHIGGPGLGRGYLHRPGATAAQFLPHPFSAVPGARLYKTGDLARYQPDGVLEFLGRRDEQVKIRGFRIELGEIETLLSQHPAVAATVVVARADHPGEKWLVAYIVPQPEHQVSAQDLRRFVQAQLPAYMVPAVFVLLEAMPLTPNGKVDRRALPAPETLGREAGASFLAPRTPTEELLAALWAGSLGVEQISRDDNFFDLGGHSLLATQLISRIRAAFAVEVPVRWVFDAPTVAGLGAHIDAARREGQGLPVPPIIPVPRTGDLPLSFAQQRLWFLDQLEGGSATYNIPAALRLRGPLHVAALAASLRALVQRHEALRTTFPAMQGIPVQVIAPHVVVPLAVVDLQTVPAEAQALEVQRLGTAEAQCPFDLARDTLLRATLLRLGVDDHVLLVTIHHIVADGWSIGILIHELAALYPAFVAGQPSPLPPLPVQYVDFAHWQRAWLQGDELAAQLTYWQEQLAGAPAVLALPTDHPRPAVQTFRGGIEYFQLSPELTHQLVRVGRACGATLYMTLLGAYGTLLARYSGQEDIIVGSPIANRTRQEIEGHIGFFVNTLLVRLDLTGDPTFTELLARVRQVTLEAYAHQDLPFEKLVEELQPVRSLSHTPLFQAAFVLQNAPMEPLELPGLSLAPIALESGTSKFDMNLMMQETAQGLHGAWEYSSDIFEAATIRRMISQFQTLLAGVVAQPQQRVATLPLLTDAERQQLLRQWNATQVAYPQAPCLHQWFEAQVARTPAALAVQCDDQQLTYRALNHRANQLAHYLQSLGVRPGVLVGLCMERSLELVVGLLGILKAGGAYVPLDPTYPTERLAFLLADAQVRVVVTQATLTAGLPPAVVPLVCVDTDWGRITPQPTTNPDSGVTPAHPAYVIYTSGSTGQPKGVLVPHAQVSRLFTATQAWLQADARDVWSLFHSYAFDFSVWEFWGALLYGGRLVVVPTWVSRAPDALYTLLARECVTVLNQTPSAFRQLMRVEDEAETELALALRLVIFGGEALELRSLQPWVARHGDQCPQFVNMYGITETTVHVTYRPLTQDELTQGGSRIGGPLPDLQVYLLDRHWQPVPLGVPGELYVGGAGVAVGYVQRPGLTAERFVPDPFGPHPGARLYKSGDLARWRLAGDLDYLGRLDAQVKVRGFRIELGEIEAVLTQHPAVETVVALAREDAPDDKRLVAYVVPVPYAQVEATQPASLDFQATQIAQWQQVFSETYQQPAPEADPRFNIIGWNDSYTGQPILPADMRVWLDSTVARIRAWRPRRVLEIGCGTGLLLFRLAPHCTEYWGTDFAPEALQFVEQQLQQAPAAWPQVRLAQRPAHDFTGVAAAAYDVVLLNSVVQYFPSLEYLVTVLEGAVRAVAPGGIIFIGDVRSLPLLEAFHAMVQVQQAPAGLPREQLRQRVRDAMRTEAELVIDPAFFRALRQHLPQISHVDVQLKRGNAHNELTQFRYDVVCQVAGEEAPQETVPWLDWQRDAFTVARVRQLLVETAPEVLGITGVPNARVQAAVRLVELLNHDRGTATAGDLWAAVYAQPQAEGVEPEAVWALSQELPYAISIDWSRTGQLGCYDVICQRRPAGGGPPGLPRLVRNDADRVRPWQAYATRPAQGQWSRQLVPQLRRYLTQSLPDYMVPAAFVLLDAIPLTPNGKIDRRALPAPDAARRGAEADFVAPRTPTEEVVASIWAEVLGVDQIGIDDNFFALGGHSLLATQLVSRVRDAFAVEVPVRWVFDAPTVAGFSVHIDVAHHGPQRLPVPPIVQVDRAGDLPLSFAQQRLWFLDQLEGASATYNIPAALRLSGPLHVAALAASLTTLVHRHEALRTTFPLMHGAPVQVIAVPQGVPLPVVDLQALPAAVQAAAVQRLMTAEAQRPFALAQGPLLRGTLVRLGETEHVLLLTLHHIVADGWSMGILVREMATLYRASCRGEAAALPVLPIQYADFAQWQRTWLQGEVLETQLSYWRAQLAGAPALLDLPTDYPRPPVQTFRGGIVSFHLHAELTQRLQAVSRQAGTTLFMTLLGAFATLLSRYSGQADVIIGSPIANRNRQAIEGLIGFFVNTLALRLDLTADPTFLELLGQVRQVTLDGYMHQDVPFEKLVEELQPERSLSYTPLFQVMFALQNAPLAPLDLPGLILTPLELESLTAKFDLTVSLAETAEGLYGVWEYNRDLFALATIQRMVGHFATLLAGLVAEPTQRVATVPLLSEAERQQLLVAWNATQTPYPAAVGIHELFEAQVTQRPEAVAVVGDEQHLTYAALDRRANHLAHHLRRLGVGPEVRVGLCVERSVEMVVGLLGILKAGGAYVPFDPSYPAERLAFMVQDAQVRVLVTQQRCGAELPIAGLPVVYLDDGWETHALAGEALPPSAMTADTLAYVMYTSGSTGRPKGVSVSHRGVVRLVQGAQYARLGADEVFLQLAPLAFDASTFELWGCLLHGARLVLLPGTPSLEELGQVLRRHQVTIVWFTAGLFHLMVDERLEDLQPVPQVLAGGDVLSVAHVKKALSAPGARQVINGYGPTENTTFTCCFPMMAPEQVKSSVPIGRPIANTQVYLLDGQLQPVPIGVAGDLYTGGAGLARGYWNRPGLTAVAFIPHPWSAVPGARLYRTGDIARYGADGVLEFLGRLDEQVKIRGFRIELGEIETILSQHPAVAATVVLARADHPGEKRLVAYIVPQPEHRVSAQELRRFVQTQLPTYMVPTAFVLLEAMPLTPNGKVDRRALPPPDVAVRGGEEGFVPPREPVESHLVQIWEDVLDVHPIGVRNNFFDLGGHSLLAVRLMVQIYRRFGLNLPIATLFQAPTVEQLACVLRQQTASSVWSPLVPIRADGSLQPFFCTHPAGGNPLYLYDLARHLGPDQPFYGLQAVGLDGKSEPFTRVEDMAAHYIAALQAVQPQGPYLLGGHSFGAYVAFEMAQQLQKQGHEVALLAILDQPAPVFGTHPMELGPDLDDARWVQLYAEIIEKTFEKTLEVTYEALQPLDLDEQLHYLMERLNRVGLLPPDVGITQLRGLLWVFKANCQAAADYVPQDVYRTRITLFRASEGNPAAVPNERIPREVAEILQEPTLGWERFSAGPVNLHFVPGNHESLVTEPHVQVLAEQLRVCLEQAQAGDFKP